MYNPRCGRVVSFVGHRHITITEEIIVRLNKLIKHLIEKENVKYFLFGSQSEFDKLCLDITTKIKKIYPKIQRIFIRAEFPYISQHYYMYLLKSYDETLFPKKILNAGKKIYVERNFFMIDNSDFCVFYYDKNYSPQIKAGNTRNVFSSNSGTKLAYDYAIKRKKKIILINKMKDF